MPDIGKRIKLKREELGLTQEELAKMLGYKSKTTIAKIENGTNDITQTKVVEFANVLDTTAAHLMGWDDKFSTESAVLAAKVAKNPDLKQLVSLYLSLNDTGKDRVMDYILEMSKLYSKE